MAHGGESSEQQVQAQFAATLQTNIAIGKRQPWQVEGCWQPLISPERQAHYDERQIAPPGNVPPFHPDSAGMASAWWDNKFAWKFEAPAKARVNIDKFMELLAAIWRREHKPLTDLITTPQEIGPGLFRYHGCSF